MLFEAKLIEFLQSNASLGWITFFEYFTALAGFVGLIVFGLIIFIKDKKLAIWFILTFIFTVLLNLLLKQIIARPRPFESYNFIMNLGNEDGFSMPSSHSAIAGVIAVFICYLSYKNSSSTAVKTLTTVCMTLYAGMIALSRMMLGVHYLTDVLVGLLVGVVIAILSLRVYNKLIKKLEKLIKEENLKD